MSQQCDLVIQVNGRRTFFLNQQTLSVYSGKLKKIVAREKKKNEIKSLRIRINDFPGGSDGFELISRFCYSNGGIKITVSNACLLYCGAVFLEMDEEVCIFNLLKQTETFLQGVFFWPWNHILESLRSCVSFFALADSYGLIQKLICAILFKISHNSEAKPLACSSSSPETANGMFASSGKTTYDDSSIDQWWFDDLTTLPPMIINKFAQNLGAYRSKNNNLILTRFLVHYLKSALQRKGGRNMKKGVVHSRNQYSTLAEQAIQGVILAGQKIISCRGLFSVLRIVSNFCLSKDYRDKLEEVIGGMLDQTTLDDLLISGSDTCVYDVDLVLRLVRIFVNSKNASAQRMKKVGSLIDKYLGEISPDQNLKISKFLEVAESLPDSARECFDEVYRAIDIYLEVSMEKTLSFIFASYYP
ncbi:hypothetical protein K2173_009008 [Erythroxylum novogranatense]|uniref:Phototropic-responsive NPH3 family protein n=1 Tax=Erythroxylum novogranatense TaxID=1862640 RepID=A0AAV8TSJ2_9ROSI|nr:hypothetical protein K2173_009008 [Erythroxylum novogranatense]